MPPPGAYAAAGRLCRRRAPMPPPGAYAAAGRLCRRRARAIVLYGRRGQIRALARAPEGISG